MPSTTREIPKNEWRSYFDDLSRLPTPAPVVSVEVDGDEVGAQIEAEHRTLTGISYDDRDDVLVIGIGDNNGRERAEHLVYQPQQIYVAAGDQRTIDVKDADGVQTLVRIEST
jgi:hypothetical protein